VATHARQQSTVSAIDATSLLCWTAYAVGVCCRQQTPTLARTHPASYMMWAPSHVLIHLVTEGMQYTFENVYWLDGNISHVCTRGRSQCMDQPNVLLVEEPDLTIWMAGRLYANCAPLTVDSLCIAILDKLTITAIVGESQKQYVSIILRAWTYPARIWSRLVAILRSSRNAG